MRETELKLLDPALNAPGSRSITLDINDRFKGATGDKALQNELASMLARFRTQAQQLIVSLLPQYQHALRVATTSYRPLQVETRSQSWRSDDRRLHVDAFSGRPNHGERILRVFANINPENVPRVWRVGAPFEEIAHRFLPQIEPYRPIQARWLQITRKTKKLRTEYDHLMLHLHDCMKLDSDYQEYGAQVTTSFKAGSVWICFSDQTPHAAMSGQYMLEQTLHLPIVSQYDPSSSPLAILQRLTQKRLI